MPLFIVRKGERVKIKTVHGGHGLQAKLSAMGLVPGMEVEVVSNDRGGPLVVKIMESRFMLGRGMAHKILVE